MDAEQTLIEQAISIVGSQKKLAKACDVSQAAVSKWAKLEKIPLERAFQIERATGKQVTKEQLRPDIFGTQP